MAQFRLSLGLFCALLCGCATHRPGTSFKNLPTGKLILLNDNSAYSWFSEPRAIVQNDKLIVGSVRAVAMYRTGQADPNWGNVELAVLNLANGKKDKVVLAQHFEQDDHDDPSFLELPDHRLLAIFSRHAAERKVFMRVSEPNNPLIWGETKEIVTPGKDAKPFSGDNVTYSNPFRYLGGRIILFYRGFDYDPNYMFSDDNARTWNIGGRLLIGKNGYGPYLKYAFDGDRTLHFIATEDHPRNYDNSLYHGFLRDGEIFDSYGCKVGKLSTDTSAAVESWDLTRLFPGDADNVAWMTDVKLDQAKHPYIAFTVQKDGRDLPKGQGGFDHRFYYGRWDGKQWNVHEMAYAGTRLYRNEDDYTGLAALDGKDPNTVYLSTDADPATGKPLISSSDNRRHHELYVGRTADAGKTWKWQAITLNSTVDNIRPILPVWNDPRHLLVWMRGSYLNNHGQWTTSIVAEVLP